MQAFVSFQSVHKLTGGKLKKYHFSALAGSIWNIKKLNISYIEN